MKFLFDSFPVVAFFAAYYLAPDPEQRLFFATGVIVVTSLIQIILSYLWWRRVETMLLVSAGLLLVLGGATLLTQDPLFLMWKPTVVNWLFALAFLASEWIGKKPLIQRVMEQALQMPAPIWYKLNRSWVGFFAFLGALNLFVAFRFSEETWVNFKLFGLLGLTMAFTVLQAVFISKHILVEADED